MHVCFLFGPCLRAAILAGIVPPPPQRVDRYVPRISGAPPGRSITVRLLGRPPATALTFNMRQDTNSTCINHHPFRDRPVPSVPYFLHVAAGAKAVRDVCEDPASKRILTFNPWSRRDFSPQENRPDEEGDEECARQVTQCRGARFAPRTGRTRHPT